MSSENPIRFNPTVHTNPTEYINQTQNIDDIRLRQSLALGGLFTPLVKVFYEKFQDQNADGLKIPDFLPGKQPSIDNDQSNIYDAPDRKWKYNTLNGGYCRSTGHLPGLDIIIPIGNYGDKLAVATVQSVRALYQNVNSLIAQEAQQLYKKNKEFINTTTFYANPLLTMQEGALSIAQTFSLLSGDKHPEFPEDPVDLFDEFNKQKTFDQFAAHSPLSLTARTANYGGYFKNAIDKTTLRLTPEFKKELDLKRKRSNSINVIPTNKGCPVARQNTPIVLQDGTTSYIKESGIQLLSDIFGKYLRHYYHQNH